MFAEAVATAQAISKEEWNLPRKPVNERDRLHDALDPKVKEHLLWLSKNWSSYFLHGGINHGVIDTNGKNSTLGRTRLLATRMTYCVNNSSWKREAIECATSNRPSFLATVLAQSHFLQFRV